MNKLEFLNFAETHTEFKKVFFLTDETKQLIIDAVDQSFANECNVKTLGFLVGMINQKYSDNNLSSAEYQDITESIRDDVLVSLGGVIEHKTKRVDKELKLYRGKEIELNKHVSTGYVGRYKTCKHGFDSLKSAKAHIDKLCQDKGIDSFMTNCQEKEYLSLWKV